MIDIRRESYIAEHHRRQRLAELENNHLLSETRPRRRNPINIGQSISSFFHSLGQLRHLRLQVSLRLVEPDPCP